MAESGLITQKHKILSKEEMLQLLNEPNCYGFKIYSDNILEALAILDLLSEDEVLLTYLGTYYEPIDQPIYFFKDKTSKIILSVKIYGNYGNWDVPSSVEKAIFYIDKMDFVIVDLENNPVLAGETTGTANVGNSQWQREGRKIGAAINNFPFLYQTYYTGTDRSQPQGPVVREPTSLQVLNHLIYSIRYQIPSFAIYYPHPDFDRRIGKDRSQTEGRKLMTTYICSLLLHHVNSRKYLETKKTLEKNILTHMLDYITETISKAGKKIIRLDNDFPVISKRDLFFEKRKEFIEYIVERINGGHIDNRFDFLSWDIKKFPKWGKYYYKFPLIKNLALYDIPIFSYLAKSKIGIILDAKRLTEVLRKRYPKDKDKISISLDIQKPTLIIPTRVFKGEKKVVAGDPESGEITAFSELFSKDLSGDKSMNVLIYGHVEPPSDFSIKETLTKADTPVGSKLFRTIKHYADCLIIGEQVITWK